MTTTTTPRSPADLDERTRRDGTTLAAVRDLIPKRCFEIVPSRSWGALATAFARHALAVAVLSRIQITGGPALLVEVPALALAWLFAGWTMTGIFVIGHDCGHMAFSERRWVNEVVGHVCLAAEFTGFHNWRIWHNYHHAKTQLRGHDPDWAEKMRTLTEHEASPLGERAHVRLGFGTPLGLVVGFWVGMFRRTFMRTLAPQIPLARGARRQLAFSSLFMVASVGAVTAALAHVGGLWAVLKYYYVPSFIAAAHGAMLTYLHHTSADALVFDRAGWTPVRGQVVSTFNVRFPRWIEALWFDINIHLPHHLAPRIPWYHLREAAESIRHKDPDVYLERRFSWRYLVASWRRPLLARGPGERFGMTSFAEARAARSAHAGPPEIASGA